MAATLEGFAGVKGGLAAVLFLQAGMYTLDSYSTLNSSPWTAESFGGDPGKLKSLKEYVCHAAVYSTIMCAGAALLAPPGLRQWPIIGAVANNGYLIWLYRRAAARAQDKGSTDWASGGKASKEAMLAWDNVG